jgi:hypothetical protein
VRAFAASGNQHWDDFGGGRRRLCGVVKRERAAFLPEILDVRGVIRRAWKGSPDR